MIYKNGHKINRINIDGKEIYKVYFNEGVVFKKYHPVTAIAATTVKQFIKTDLKDFWTDEIDYEICFGVNWNSSCLFGCRPDKSYQEYSLLVENNTSGQFMVRKGGTTVNGTQPAYYKISGSDTGRNGSTTVNLLNCDRGDNNALQIYDIAKVHTIKKEGDNLYHNNKLMAKGSGYNDFFLTYLPPYFFKLNQVDFAATDNSAPNSPNANGTRYLYYAKFYKNGKIYRDYIPVLDENGVPSLYERETHTFLYSDGERPLEYFEGKNGIASCVYGFTESAYVDTEIAVADIGRWELRLQSPTLASSPSYIGGFGASRADRTGLYFYISNNYYIFQIGDQQIQTNIEFAKDYEVKIKIDLKNKKLIVEQNNQQTFENIITRTYDLVSTDNLENLPNLTIGKINGWTSHFLNIRFYQSKIYNKNGELIQNLKPRVDLSAKQGILYDDITKKTYGTSSILYI